MFMFMNILQRSSLDELHLTGVYITADHEYILFFLLTNYQLPNMLERQSDINQQDFKIVDVHFDKTE